MPEITISLMSGPKDGAELTFETLLNADRPTELTIGRREGCDVCLSYDSQVSREHAVVIYDGDMFWLEDLDSTNGTFVNDKRIEGRAPIAPGQLFRVGRTWLRIEPITPYDAPDLDDLSF